MSANQVARRLVIATEKLLADLRRTEDDYLSPEWHEEVLRGREEAIRAKKDEFIPWSVAKKIIRARNP